VLLFCLALSGIWPVAVAVLVALGWFSITLTATANSRLQIITPPQLRGRVMSLYTLLFMGTTPIGSIVLGTLADRQGVQVATAEVAILCGLGTIAGFLYLRRHRAEMPASPERQATAEVAPVRS
jgi:predicted MFS family arabinose efflux permease